MEKWNLKSGKQVLLSDPYNPKQGMMTPFQGRENELRMIFAAWIAGLHTPPLAPLMVGDPGVGKNRIVYELKKKTGLDLYIMQGHEDITAEDLACSVRFAEGGQGRMEYVLSPLVTAMLRGAICFIDEIGKIRPRALALLVSVLDERRYIDSTLLGERVEAAPSFRFVAATNTGEVSDLPEFIQSRMRPVITVDRPREEEINRLIHTQEGVTQENRDALTTEFWSLWKGRDLHPSPRDAIHLMALAASLSDYARTDGGGLLRPDADPSEIAVLLGQGSRKPPIQPDHLKEAFHELFGRRGIKDAAT